MDELWTAFETPEKIRRDFDTMLDRVEEATQHGRAYDFIDHVADVELLQKFMRLCWDGLDHREQVRYHARTKWLQSGRRPAS